MQITTDIQMKRWNENVHYHFQYDYIDLDPDTQQPPEE